MVKRKRKTHSQMNSDQKKNDNKKRHIREKAAKARVKAGSSVPPPTSASLASITVDDGQVSKKRKASSPDDMESNSKRQALDSSDGESELELHGATLALCPDGAGGADAFADGMSLHDAGLENEPGSLTADDGNTEAPKKREKKSGTSRMHETKDKNEDPDPDQGLEKDAM